MKKIILILLLSGAGLLFARAADTTADAKAAALKTAAAQKAKTDAANNASAAAKAKQDSTAKALLAAKAKQDAADKAAAAGKSDTSTADTVRQWIGWVLILLVICLFFGMTWYSNLLRDPILDITAFKAAAVATGKYKQDTDVNDIPKPYSLARSQLAVWTAVIGCSYLYMELCKCSGVPVTIIDKTLLGLMGISAATTAAGNVIDNNATPAQQAAPNPSQGFFKDIMSDQNGINIHRFQNVVWTLIAVTLYLSQIPEVQCGHLPTLDATLVSLTAISSATYLGLKINENVTPAVPPPPAATTTTDTTTKTT